MKKQAVLALPAHGGGGTVQAIVAVDSDALLAAHTGVSVPDSRRFRAGGCLRFCPFQ